MKKILLFLSSLFIVSHADAQCSSFLQNSSASGFIPDKIATDSQGNIFMLSDFTGQFTYQNATYTAQCLSDLLIVKSDDNNNPLWGWHFYSSAQPGTSEVHATAMVIDQADNIYVTGYFKGNITFGTVNYSSQGTGTWDAFVLKLTGNGGIAWAKRFGGNNSEQFTSIDVNAGQVYLAGIVQANSTIGNYSFPGNGSEDMLVAKMDTAGNLLNAKTYGGAGADAARSVKIIPGGDIVLAANYGSSFSMDGNTLPAYSLGGMLLARLNPNSFSVKWVRPGGSSNFTAFTANVDADAAANAYLLFSFGNTFSMGSNTLTSHGDADVGFAKIDSTGSVQVVRSFGGPNVEYAGEIRCQNNSVFIAATCQDSVRFTGNIALNNKLRGIQNPLLTRFDANGNYLGHLLGNDSSSTVVYSNASHLCFNTGQDLLWTGNFLNKLIFLGLSTTPANASNNFDKNAFLLKVCGSVLSIKEVSGAPIATLFPNPCTGKCYLTANQNIKSMELFNQLGQNMQVKVEMDNYSAAIFTTQLPAGIYYLRIYTGNDNAAATQKLIVE